MKVKIDSKKDNPLFSRVDVHATASDFASTPSRLEIVKELAKEVSCEVGAVVVNQISQPFGSKSVKVNARVYPSADAAKKAEPAYKFARGQPKEVIAVA